MLLLHARLTQGAKVPITLVVLSLASSAIAQAQSADSAVAAVRAVYQEVEGAIKDNRFAEHDTTVTCGEQELDAHFLIWRDSAEVVRRLDAQYGSDDMAVMEHYYYDRYGRLRFIFAQDGHVPDIQIEERVYYDENRRELRRVRERTSGRAFPFARTTPLLNPSTWYKQFCAER